MRRVIDIWDKAQYKWVSSSILLHKAKIGDGTIELVKLGTLCKAIGRSKQCVLLWETEKKFPVSRYKIVNEKDKLGQIRWYSFRQLIMIQEYVKRLLGAPNKMPNKNQLTAFFTAVRNSWRLDDTSIDDGTD